jgi:hypothetical protein
MEVSKLNLERAIYNKRSIIGYDLKSVRNHIQSLQEKQQKELKLLQEKLMNEKSFNQKLKEELEVKNQLLPDHSISSEVNSMLMDLFVQHTKLILEKQNEFQKQEREQLELLEKKKQQKEWTKKRLEDAIDYLKSLQSKPFESRKELSE